MSCHTITNKRKSGTDLLTYVCLIPFFVKVCVVCEMISAFVKNVSVKSSRVSCNVSYQRFNKSVAIFILVRGLCFYVPLCEDNELKVLIAASSNV